jgi:hypothetical protein
LSKFVNIDIFIFMDLCFETPVTVPMTLKLLKTAALTLMSNTTASWQICKKQRGKRLQMPCSHEHLQTFSERQT